MAFLSFPDRLWCICPSTLRDHTIAMVSKDLAGDRRGSRVEPQTQFHAIVIELLLDGFEPIGKPLPARAPIARFFVPACVENENLYSHAVGDLDLLHYAFLVHGIQVRLPVPPLVPLLICPGVVEYVRFPAFSVWADMT